MHKGHFKPKGCSSSCALSLCLTQVRQIHIRKREKKKGCAHHQGRDCRRIFFSRVSSLHFLCPHASFFFPCGNGCILTFFFFFTAILSAPPSRYDYGLSAALRSQLCWAGATCFACTYASLKSKNALSLFFFFFKKDRIRSKWRWSAQYSVHRTICDFALFL